MKSRYLFLSCIISLFVCTDAAAESVKINSGWLFSLSDENQAKEINYDDSGWRELSLPHDWAFENGYSKNGAQTDKGGYACGGIGWYRKHLDIPGGMTGKRLFLDFDAVYMNSEVWINGIYLGKRPYGYISFSYEISKFIKSGDNVISVRVDNSLEPSARWYHGCGIYGNVYLRTENDLHFIKDGIHVRTPEIAASEGSVSVSYELSDISAASEIETVIKKDGKTVSRKKTAAGENVNLKVDSPQLWSPDSPQLYELRIRVKDHKGRIQDEETINFGFRTIDWDPETGFFLNGKNLKLRGVCEHLEGGPVGAAWTEELMEWKISLLKEMGCNAIRTSHNPQLPFFYDICDRMGILVMDEAFDGWRKKAEHDYGAQAFDKWWERDLRDMIRRDRNHPSVFIYSLGNETKGNVAAEMVAVCHEEDPDRMTTSGHSASEVMDVLGVNGNSEKQSFIHSYRPSGKAFIGTETPHTWQVRGYYRTKTWYRDGYPNKSQDPFPIPDLTENEIFGYDWTSPDKRRNVKQVFNSSYDNATVRITARHNIAFLRDLPWYSGHFRWTGFDYLGEAGYVHGGWPFRAFMGGVIDLAGLKKDHYFLYQSQWRENDLDMIHILPHWTHPSMKKGSFVPVWVYTTGDSAELFLNGKSLGIIKKGKEWNRMQCEWLVPWSPGEITAVAYRNGKEICRTSVKSSDTGADIDIVKDCTAGEISIYTFTTIDKYGNIFPYGDNRVHVVLPYGAEMLSFENGNPVDTECNFHADSRRAFFGLCRAFIRDLGKNGTITVGCINGDRSLNMSDTASICVKDINIRTGKTTGRKYSIRYTVDGSEPDETSAPYLSPFKVRPNTIVKATAFFNGKAVMKMQETFGGDDTIYWGTPGEEICKTKGLQAEYAKLHNASVRNSTGENVNGAGYVVMESAGSITWYQENDGSSIDAHLRIRYSQESGNPTFVELRNNGELIRRIEFTDTGSTDRNWEYIVIPVTIYSGANYIELKVITEQSPSIDEIEISGIQ